jgi:hypothetical protein
VAGTTSTAGVIFLLSSLLSFVVPWSSIAAAGGSAFVFLFGHVGAAAAEPPIDDDFEEQQPKSASLGVVLLVVILAVFSSPVLLIVLVLLVANKRCNDRELVKPRSFCATRSVVSKGAFIGNECNRNSSSSAGVVFHTN